MDESKENKLKEIIKEAIENPEKWVEEILGIKLCNYQKELIKVMYNSNPSDIKDMWVKTRVKQLSFNRYLHTMGKYMVWIEENEK